MQPIGDYRKILASQPNQKRSKKRKRRTKKQTSSETTAPPADAHALSQEVPVSANRQPAQKSLEDASLIDDAPAKTDPPQPPSIQTDLLIGFNSVTRHLESLSPYSSPTKPQGDPKERRPRHISAVFLLRPLDDLIYSHLPLLCHTASLAYPDLSGTRLVLLDPTTEVKVAAALAQSPRISVLAVLEPEDEGNGTRELCEYVRKHTEPVDVPWLKEAMEGKWLGTKIDVQ